MTPAGPLAGRRVLVPRAVGQADRLVDAVRGLGGEPVEAPVLLIEPGDTAALRAAVRDLAAGRYGLVAFTSANAVDAVADVAAGTATDGADALSTAGLAGVVAGTVVGAVGRGTTRRLHDRSGLRPDVLPDEATAAALGAALPAGPGRALLPLGDLAGTALADTLRRRGWDCDTVVAYRTRRPATLPPGVADALLGGDVDLVALTSPSTVRNLLALLDGRTWPATTVAIGPVTAAACADLDVEVARVADPHDLDGLLAALVAAAGADV